MPTRHILSFRDPETGSIMTRSTVLGGAAIGFLLSMAASTPAVAGATQVVPWQDSGSVVHAVGEVDWCSPDVVDFEIIQALGGARHRPRQHARRRPHPLRGHPPVRRHLQRQRHRRRDRVDGAQPRPQDRVQRRWDAHHPVHELEHHDRLDRRRAPVPRRGTGRRRRRHRSRRHADGSWGRPSSARPVASSRTAAPTRTIATSARTSRPTSVPDPSHAGPMPA